MHRLHLTLPTAEKNIALDEALLDWAEDEGPDWECLRLWESPRPIVVVGRSSRVQQEVNVAACRARDIPILRRSSGGAAIVAGPGCLMYAVVLSCERRPKLRDIRHAHSFVLSRLAAALQPLLANRDSVRHVGTSDLAIADCGERRGPPPRPGSRTTRLAEKQTASPRKFSGNSMRAKQSHVLYHGTLLYDFDVSLLETYLRMPPRVPEYRSGRSHCDFVANLPIGRLALIEAVGRAWPTDAEVIDWPAGRVEQLVAERYGRESWNYDFG